MNIGHLKQVGNSEQQSLLLSGVLYLAAADSQSEQVLALELPDRCELLVATTAADASEQVQGRRLLVILFDLAVEAEQWEALAREFASPDCELPVPLVALGEQLPGESALQHMAALGVVDWIIGEQAGHLLEHKIRGLVRLQRRSEWVGRQARTLVES